MTFNELPGWDFIVREVSAGVFKVTAHDTFGHSVEQTGIDPDDLLNECKKHAQKILNTSTKGKQM